MKRIQPQDVLVLMVSIGAATFSIDTMAPLADTARPIHLVLTLMWGGLIGWNLRTLVAKSIAVDGD